MRTGRPPLPTRLKALKGTLRAHRVNRREPRVALGAPPVPASLPVSARPVWRWLTRLLREMRVIARVDGPALLLAACRLGDYQRLRQIVDEKGLTYTTVTTSGSEMHRARPEVALMTAAWRDALQALVQLGLTPSARSRVAVAAAPEPEDELESFLAPGKRGR